MLLRIWRLIAIMFTALSMGVALCHLLEMPAKMTFDGAFWLRLLQALYPPGFGTMGSFFEAVAVLTTPVLVFLVYRRRAAFGWTLLGALCVLAAHAVFWIWVAPVNATLVPLTAETLPENWMALRSQWEYGHAVRAVFQIVGLGSLVFSLLAEIPHERSADIIE
jgi:hypothetical protein